VSNHTWGHFIKINILAKRINWGVEIICFKDLMQLTAFPGQALPPSEPTLTTVASPSSTAQYVQPSCMNHQVQVATQTTTDKKVTATTPTTGSSSGTGMVLVGKGKKTRYQFQQRQSQNHQQVQQNAGTFSAQNMSQQNYQIDTNTGLCPQDLVCKASLKKMSMARYYHLIYQILSHTF
jgi:hypothetical protein